MLIDMLWKLLLNNLEDGWIYLAWDDCAQSSVFVENYNIC